MSAGSYLLIFFTSVAVTFILTPVSGALAIRFNAVDSPSGRKVHRKTVPLWGGFAVLGGIFLPPLILGRFITGFSLDIPGSPGSGHLLTGVFSGALFITLLGAADDLSDLSPTTKLFGQVIACLIAMQYGLRIESLRLPFSGFSFALPLMVSIIATVIWIVLFINSINLLDGLDGLAAGVTGIASLVFFIIALLQISRQTDPGALERLLPAAVLSASLCGGCLGFLKFNFPPAKIFLGDSGSLLLGYMAGALTVTGILKTAGAFTLAVPLILFGVPVLDALLSFTRRVLSRRHFMEADKDHIHHRLLYRPGWNSRKVALRIYTVTFLLGLLALGLTII